MSERSDLPDGPDEDAPWADGPDNLLGAGLPAPGEEAEEAAALDDPAPSEEVPPSPS